jgi:hypothetical protein
MVLSKEKHLLCLFLGRDRAYPTAQTNAPAWNLADKAGRRRLKAAALSRPHRKTGMALTVRNPAVMLEKGCGLVLNKSLPLP